MNINYWTIFHLFEDKFKDCHKKTQYKTYFLQAEKCFKKFYVSNT